MSSPIGGLPSRLHFHLTPEVLERFPGTKVALLVLEIPVLSKKGQPKEMQNFLSELKQRSVRQIVDFGITPDNYLETRVCRSLVEVFRTFKAGPEKQSTIVNLLRRAATEGNKIREGKKADMGTISNFVDYYNCQSLQTMTPMGATDIRKIAQRDQEATVYLRLAREGESFITLGKDETPVPLTPTSVVYADEEKIFTGFWHYRDARECCVPNESAKTETGEPQKEFILLVADQAERDGEASSLPIAERPGDVEEAILRSSQDLHRIGGHWYAYDVLSRERPAITIDFTNILEGTVAVTPPCGN